MDVKLLGINRWQTKVEKQKLTESFFHRVSFNFEQLITKRLVALVLLRATRNNTFK